MKDFFEIQTLSECRTGLRDYRRLGDPVTIITGGMAILSQIFPNLFGSAELLTDAEINSLFPGTGLWTTQLKGYLRTTKYKKDMVYWYPGNYGRGGAYSRGMIAQFVLENQNSICPGADCNWTGTICQQCMTAFTQILQQESRGGGDQFPPGPVFNMNTLLLVGGGVLLLIALSKKKRRRKK